MLKSFFGPSDQTTPRASAQDKNPFESFATLGIKQNGKGTPTSSRKSSFAFAPPTPTSVGFKIPFFSGNSHDKRSSGAAVASTATTDGNSTPDAQHTTFSDSPRANMAAPTTSVTRHEPEFNFNGETSNLAKRRQEKNQTQPASTGDAPSTAPSTNTGNNGSVNASPRGKLSLKIIQARNLVCSDSSARPYVVASYDQNEFIGREPIHDAEGTAPVAVSYVSRSGTQTPMQRQSPPRGSGASHALGSLATSSAQNALAKSLEAHTLSESKRAGHSRNGSASITSQPSKKSELPSPHNPVWKQEVIFDVVNDDPGQLTVCVFDRSPEHHECFLGAVDISPRFSTSQPIDAWFKLQPRADERVTGEIRLQYRYEVLEGKRSLSVKDFEFLRMIGKGTFGRVFQVRKKDTRRIYAMKVLSKREIIAKKEVAHTIGERKILQRSSECPFLLGLKFSFQSESELYLVMDYKSGGELFHHLQQEGRFSEDRARFYTAEIVLAFEHLHKYDIVYRDLKPENILLDATGHIVLCDFGLSKPDLPSDALTTTFCGTTEYLAPEVLLDDHGYSKLVDFWSLGVLLFEMCCGWSPFYAEDTQQMYKNICFGKIKFPRGVIGDDGKQFVKGLLNRNPRHRLGATRDAAELKEHAFFKCIDWIALSQRKVVPPFTPYVDSDESVANFDAEFTEADIHKEAPASVFDDSDTSEAWIHHASSLAEDPKEGVPIRGLHGPSSLSGSVQDAFRGFSYAGNSFDDRPSWLSQDIRITPAEQNGNSMDSSYP